MKAAWWTRWPWAVLYVLGCAIEFAGAKAKEIAAAKLFPPAPPAPPEPTP